MFSFLALRLASRRAPLTFSLIKPANALQLRSITYTATRSFLVSSFRAEPSNTRSKTKTTAKKATPSRSKSVKPKPKLQPKKKSRVTAKKRAAPKKKKIVKKKPAKPKSVVVPRDIKIPKTGPSPYTFWIAKYYLADHSRPTRENITEFASEAGKAWKALSDNERENFTAECKIARLEAEKKRGVYLRSVKPAVMKEINRRRIAKGKPRIIVPREPSAKKHPVSSFFVFLEDYRSKHHGMGTLEIAKGGGEEWRKMTDQAKERYIQEAARRTAAA